MNRFQTLFGAPRSLQRNLIVNMMVALLICVVLAMSLLVWEFLEHLEENLENALLREARDVLAEADPSKPDLGFDANALRFRGTDGAYRYTVLGADLVPIVGTETAASLEVDQDDLRPGGIYELALPDDRIGLALFAQKQGTGLVILVSTRAPLADSTLLHVMRLEVQEQTLPIILGVFILLGSALFASRLSLRPLSEVLGQARGIGPAAPERRLDTRNLPSEIVPLVDSVNEAFSRLEQGYRAQREFSSNVAHEVRTPLAILRSTVERIDEDPLRQSLTGDVDRLQRLFEQMIDLARADSIAGQGHVPVNLHGLALTVSGDLAAQSIRSGRTLAVTGSETVRVRGNEGLMYIALSNLVRNGLAYAPRGTEVEIAVQADPPSISVLDRGPGIPEKLRTVLFERFRRGTDFSANREGAGLGLAIAKSVADAHDATITIATRPGGGCIFTIAFGAQPRIPASDGPGIRSVQPP